MRAASDCLVDAVCPMARYASLVLAAVDARERDVPCFHLLRGTGVPIDRARARRCFESEVHAEGSCRQSTPSLARLELAMLSGSKSVLAGCLDDTAVEVGRTEPGKIDVCDTGLGLTTLHMVACVQLEHDELAVRAAALHKAFLARFGKTRWASLSAASRAHADYAHDTAECVGELYAGGTMQPIQILSAEASILSARLERWESFLRSIEREAPNAAAARKRMLAKRKAALEMPPPVTIGGSWTKPSWQARLSKNEEAYAAYRAKELALVHELGGASEALMDVERTNDLTMLESP